jgi:outer membrane protein assembly factor BamB
MSLIKPIEFVHDLWMRYLWALLGAIILFNGNHFPISTAHAGLALNGNGEEEAKKTGFKIQLVETEVLDMLDDFNRFAKRKDWAKAFQVSDDLFSQTSGGMVEDTKGFHIPFYDRLWSRMVSMSDEGKRAYRLFYDAQAESLFKEVTPGNEERQLLKIYRQFFLTEIGDNAADRLAELSYEQGEFSRAARIWDQILRHCPDTDLDRGELTLKRAAVLARTGDVQELKKLKQEVGALERAEVLVAGNTVTLSDYLASLKPVELKSAQGTEHEMKPFNLAPEDLQPVWQFPLIDEMTDHSMKAIHNNYYSRIDALLVPPIFMDEKRVYINWFGNILALDRVSGKFLWRLGKTHEILTQQSSNFLRGLGLVNHDVMIHKDKLLVVGLYNKENSRLSYSLSSLNPETGAVEWKTSHKDHPLKAHNFTGETAIVGDTLYGVVHKGNEYFLAAVATSSGKLESMIPLGSLQTNGGYYGYVQLRPKPSLTHHQGKLFIMTHFGALLTVEVATQEIIWAFQYDRPSIPQNAYYNSRNLGREMPLSTYGAAMVSGNQLLLKETYGSRLYAINIERHELMWKRPVNQSDKVLLADDERIILLGRELSAIRVADRKMEWSTKLVAESGKMNGLVTDQHIYVYSRTGLLKIDRADGDIQKHYRLKADSGSVGGRIFLRDGLLYTVSNRKICAYKIENSP